MLFANVLQPLIDAEEWILETLHGVGLEWGLAIVALTILVRLATVPLTVRQFRAQQRLAEHAPAFKRIREKHGADVKRLREETAAYYREHKVNPLGALGPTLLQIPIFISLYYLMRQDVQSGLFEHAGFLFIPDLTARPHGAVLVVLILGYTVSQLVASAIATRTLEGGHRKVALALPLLFVGVATRFPAGLLVYWITSSLWNVGQQIALWRAKARIALVEVVPAVEVEPAPTPGASPTQRRPHPRSKKKRRSRRGAAASKRR
ncbi:MAG: YidC/Oxa1 family membrane protein insertase [Thermoleophilaceae bacterium]